VGMMRGSVAWHGGMMQPVHSMRHYLGIKFPCLGLSSHPLFGLAALKTADAHYGFRANATYDGWLGV